MSGTVCHKFSDSKTTFNMMNAGHYPFSISRFHDSPWLKQTDAIAQFCAKPQEDRGKYRMEEIKEAVYCLLGDYSSSHFLLAPTDWEPLILQDGRTDTFVAR